MPSMITRADPRESDASPSPAPIANGGSFPRLPAFAKASERPADVDAVDSFSMYRTAPRSGAGANDNDRRHLLLGEVDSGV